MESELFDMKTVYMDRICQIEVMLSELSIDPVGSTPEVSVTLENI